MSIIDKFRNILGVGVRHAEREMSADGEHAIDYLNQRAAQILAKVNRDVEDRLDGLLAEQQRQFDQAKPLTFEGTFEELPAPAKLLSHDSEQPEAAATAAPVVASDPPVEAVNDPPPRRTAPAGRKRPRLSGIRTG